MISNDTFFLSQMDPSFERSYAHQASSVRGFPRAWLGVTPAEADTARMAVGIQQSDSHHHMKCLHLQSPQLLKPPRHEVPPRIRSLIDAACARCARLYQPDTLER
jgi:hypothetical protein